MNVTPLRSGMPDPGDVAAQYRLHADRISNAELPRPVRAEVIETMADGSVHLTAFGTPPLPSPMGD